MRIATSPSPASLLPSAIPAPSKSITQASNTSIPSTLNLINELRGGINFEHVKQLPLGFYNSSFTAAQIGINQFTLNGAPLPPSQAGFPTLSVSGYLGFGSGTAASNLDYSRTYQINDNLTWVRGRHTLLFGGDVRQVSDNATTNNTPYGSQSFTGAQTGNAGADFLIGIPSSVITPEGVPLTAARQWRYGFYAQDNFKASSKLTLNFGLRYDLWLPPHNNLTSSRTLDFSTSTPTLVPLPDPLWKISHKDFSPRFTFAYSMPWQTVLRGGYGITFYGGKFDNINILQLNPPIDSSFSIANDQSGGPATYRVPGPSLDRPSQCKRRLASSRRQTPGPLPPNLQPHPIQAVREQCPGHLLRRRQRYPPGHLDSVLQLRCAAIPLLHLQCSANPPLPHLWPYPSGQLRWSVPI